MQFTLTKFLTFIDLYSDYELIVVFIVLSFSLSSVKNFILNDFKHILVNVFLSIKYFIKTNKYKFFNLFLVLLWIFLASFGFFLLWDLSGIENLPNNFSSEFGEFFKDLKSEFNQGQSEFVGQYKSGINNCYSAALEKRSNVVSFKYFKSFFLTFFGELTIAFSEEL